MAYVPNNRAIFIAAHTGAMAGMAASNRLPADYTGYAGIAVIASAFAQAVDTLWGANPSSTVQEWCIQQSSEACWQNRAPQPSAAQNNPLTYYDIASALVLSANASEDWFVAEGIDPNLSSGGAVPAVSGISGATIVERPGGVRIAARLRQSEIDPSIAINSFTKTAPNTSEDIYRRGDLIAGVTALAAYNASGPPSIATVTDGYVNGAADVGGGVWSAPAPAYTNWSRTASVSGDGVDADPDPYWTATLSATGDIVVTRSITTYFASDIYIGVSANAAIVGADVYNAGLQPGFSDVVDAGGFPLKRVRQAGQGSVYPAYEYVDPGPDFYAYLLYPKQAQYTAGVPGFYNNDTGFVVPMTAIADTTILRNGITRTYEVRRTSALQGSSFNLRVT